MSRINCFDNTLFQNRFSPKEGENEQLVAIDALNSVWKEFNDKIVEFNTQYGENISTEGNITDVLPILDKYNKLRESIMLDIPEYRRKVQNIPETYSFQFVQDMVIRATQYIFAEDKKLIYNVKDITGQEIYSYVKDRYIEEGKYSEIERVGEGNYDVLWKRSTDVLRTMGIKFDEEDKLDINEGETNNKLYAPEPFTTDWKKTSPYAIKLACATLAVAEANEKWNQGQPLPSRKLDKELGTYFLNQFNKVFVTLMDKLSNTSDINVLNEKMLELAKTDPNYVRFFQRVGGDLATGKFDFSKFEEEDWKFFIDFYQVFTKQFPEAIVQYISGGETWNAPANLFTASKDLQDSWIENIKTLSTEPLSIISYNKKTKTYKANIKEFPETTLKQPVEMTNFLGKLGIFFPIEEYIKLSTEQKNSFAKVVNSIYTQLKKVDDISSVKGKFLGINGPLNTLSKLYVDITNPNRDNTYTGVDGEKHQSYTENNTVSVLENEFNEVETLDELLEKRPELNDIFSKNSLILKKGGQFFDEDGYRTEKKLKLSYIQGTKNIDTEKGNKTSKLGLSDRFIQEMNQNIDGNYYILVPADSSTEWMINYGNHISFNDVQENKAWNKVYDTFSGYLIDDINVALDFKNRSSLHNIGNKAKELRLFKDILNNKDLEAINKMIEEESPIEDFEKYVEEHKGSINESIKEFIESVNEETKNTLLQGKKIVELEDSKFAISGLQNKFFSDNSINSYNLSEEELNNILSFLNMNYIINNIELHKTIFGDPYQFAIKNNKLDETKRIKLFLSPRKTTFDSPEFNTFLNNTMNSVGEIALSPEDVGYHEFKSYTSTVTLKDINIHTDTYNKVNEADAFSVIMDTTYREVKNKNSRWTDEAEKWHQWQMAYTRQALDKKGIRKYSSEALKEADKNILASPEPEYRVEVLKPVATGVDKNANWIKLVGDKFSQMPLYYKAVENTNLEKLYIKMLNEKKGYVIYESGRKIGAESMHSLYNADGSFNEQPFNNNLDVPWKAYGIQVETSHEEDHDQTRGSQLTKMATMDLFNNGEPYTQDAIAAERIKQLYEKYKQDLDNLHQDSYERLLNKLGIEDDGQSFRIVDPLRVSETLEYEMLRRELSENAKETIELDENGQFRIPFEASPYYKQIKNIIYSMINKAFISPKMNGGMHVQVPATLWENEKEGRNIVLKTAEGYKKISREEYNALSDDEKKKVKLTSSKLKFYTKEDPYCEILLPAWFKDQFDKKNFPTDQDILNYLNDSEEGKKILRGIAFRIPTQALSSVEVFRVKGFIPKFMGDTVVVPSEITSKAGSDFDIDKLNMYLRNTYVDSNGNVRLVTYQGSKEATIEFFRNEYKEGLRNKLERITDKDEFRNTVLTILNKLETVEGEQFNQVFAPTSEEEREFYKNYRKVFDSILLQAEEKDVLPSELYKEKIDKLLDKADKYFIKLFEDSFASEYADKMYKKALENEYYDSLENILTLPENYERLISPVDDAGLQKDSEHLDELMGVDETTIKNRILDRNYITKLRHAFLMGKRWVGIAAVNITGQSLTQKAKIYIDPFRFGFVKEFDRKFLGDGKVVLPHNTVTVNGEGYISMSGVKTADNRDYISSRLSGYATTFVDIAKDPYILKIIQSDIVVGTFMFLERIGCGKNTVFFMNQPIIQEYLKYIDSATKKSLYNQDNIAFIKNQFPTGATRLEDVSIDVDALEDNIRNYYQGKLSEAENAVQHVIFDEFLKYTKMAGFSFKLSQATNYDTTRFKDSDSFSLKNRRTNIAQQSNIFSSADDILYSNFVGKQKDFISSGMEAMGTIFKLETDELREVTNSVMKEFEEREFISQDDFDDVATKVKASFLDYIIQVKSGLNTRIQELLVSQDSVANQLERLKKKYPGMQILKDLKVVSSSREQGAKSVKLTANVKDAANENLYVEMMRELKQVEPEFYKGLILVSLLQGNRQSNISIKNIIPIEDYAEVLKPIIDTLSATPEIKMFSNGMFQRNNWKDENVMSTFTPKLFESEEDFWEDEYGNIIYKYFSPAFTAIKDLNIKVNDRKILLLSPMYNVMDIDKDFLKVNRVVKLSDTEYVDLQTGLSIPPRTFAVKKAKGDMSLQSVYGYQKVKYADGTPLLTAKGMHVYKLINLWGDGQLAVEYYTDFRPSILDNGTVKVQQELTDEELINHFAPKAQIISTQQTKPVEQRELFTLGKAKEKNSFRGKKLEFVDKIETKKDTPVAMQNVKKDNLIKIDEKVFRQKFEDKTWTTPAKQLDGSYATPLAENQFSSFDEFLTFALIHEVKHDSIFKRLNETTGQYEDRINQAALQDLRANYNISQEKPVSLESISPEKLGLKTNLKQDDFKC